MPIYIINDKNARKDKQYALTYGNTGVKYYFNKDNYKSYQRAYNKILKYVRAIHANKR